MINRASSITIRLLWRTLPARDQLQLLVALPVNSGRHHPASTVSLYTMPPSDPGPVWRKNRDRLDAAEDLTQRAKNLLELAHQLYGQPYRPTRRPPSRY